MYQWILSEKWQKRIVDPTTGKIKQFVMKSIC